MWNLVLALVLQASAQDACVTDAAVMGCPLADGDGDGVADLFDLCPDFAERLNGYQDDDGCPDEVPIYMCKLPLTGFTFTFTGKRSRVDAKSRRYIEKTFAVLADFPEYHAELRGFSDEGEGETPEDREALALARVEAVRAALVARGVEGSRILVAYGGDELQENSDSAAARRLRRRVELLFVPNQ